MSKAEEFIKRQSHIIENPTSVWISSYNARKAVEIAKEEVIEKACEWLIEHCGYIDTASFDLDDVISNFRKALEEDSI